MRALMTDIDRSLPFFRNGATITPCSPLDQAPEGDHVVFPGFRLKGTLSFRRLPWQKIRNSILYRVINPAYRAMEFSFPDLLIISGGHGQGEIALANRAAEEGED